MTLRRTTTLAACCLSLLAALALNTALTQPAAACGGYGVIAPPTPEQQVRRTLTTHLVAVKQGRADRLKAAWDLAGARVTTLATIDDGSEVVKTEAADAAIARWGATTDRDMTWTIENVTMVADNLAVARLDLTWKGQPMREVLTLLKVGGAWKLVGKVHVPLATTPLTAGTAGTRAPVISY